MSISQDKVFVNPKKYNKWTMKKELNQAMAQKLLDAGLDARGTRMHDCSTKIEITYCAKCGKYEITNAKLCRDRLCPVCSWRLSMKRYADMLAVCSAIIKDYPENEWSFLTLTVKNCDSAVLGETLSKMSTAFNRMRQRKLFKDKILGWAKTVEVTFNPRTYQVHPHLHILILWQKGVDRETEGARLKNLWIAACADDLITSYRGQNIKNIKAENALKETADITGAVLETFKYTQKASSLLSMPLSVFRNYAKQMNNKRCLAYGGIIKDYLRTLRINTNDEPADLEPLRVCTNCGNTELTKGLYAWSFAERSYLYDPDGLAIEFEKAVEKTLAK